MTGNVTFYFVRHGETYLNKYERMQGWSNAPLTERGKRDCTASGRGLANIRFDAVYTSDLQRTKDTAKLILAENKVSADVPMIETANFREVFFGSFEGLPAKEIWAKVIEHAGDGARRDLNPVPNRQLELDSLHAIDPEKDAEDYMTFWLRIEKGLYELLQKHKDTNHNVLVVSHGLAINTMLQGIIPDFAFNGYLLNASVSIVHYQNGQFKAEVINQTEHFKY